MIHSPPRGQRFCQGNLSRKTFDCKVQFFFYFFFFSSPTWHKIEGKLSAQSCPKGGNQLSLSHLRLFHEDRWGFFAVVFFFKLLGKHFHISWAESLPILPAARHHKAAFRGNWLLVYVNACCHVLFTLLLLREEHSLLRMASTCCPAAHVGRTISGIKMLHSSLTGGHQPPAGAFHHLFFFTQHN